MDTNSISCDCCDDSILSTRTLSKDFDLLRWPVNEAHLIGLKYWLLFSTVGVGGSTVLQLNVLKLLCVMGNVLQLLAPLAQSEFGYASHVSIIELLFEFMESMQMLLAIVMVVAVLVLVPALCKLDSQ